MAKLGEGGGYMWIDETNMIQTYLKHLNHLQVRMFVLVAKIMGTNTKADSSLKPWYLNIVQQSYKGGWFTPKTPKT